MINDKFVELETERLILRKINDNDALTLYNNIFNNFDWYKFYYQVQFQSFEEYKHLVEKYKNWYASGNHFRWGIVNKDDNEIIGIVQLHSKDELNNKCKLGYIISYRHNKKGYMIEVVKKVIEFAFTILDYHRIEANIVLENEDSIKIVENMNMTFESIKKITIN